MPLSIGKILPPQDFSVLWIDKQINRWKKKIGSVQLIFIAALHESGLRASVFPALSLLPQSDEKLDGTQPFPHWENALDWVLSSPKRRVWDGWERGPGYLPPLSCELFCHSVGAWVWGSCGFSRLLNTSVSLSWYNHIPDGDSRGVHVQVGCRGGQMCPVRS